MKSYRRFLILPVAAVAVLAVWSYTGSGKKEKTGSVKNQVLLEVMTSTLNSYHFQPMTFNDDFSEKDYKLYLDRTDPGKKFFLASDIKEFEKFKDKIDDEVNNGTFGFFDLVNSVISKRIKECAVYYKELLASPFS